MRCATSVCWLLRRFNVPATRDTLETDILWQFSLLPDSEVVDQICCLVVTGYGHSLSTYPITQGIWHSRHEETNSRGSEGGGSGGGTGVDVGGGGGMGVATGMTQVGFESYTSHTEGRNLYLLTTEVVSRC